jgi:hypothetical protein
MSEERTRPEQGEEKCTERGDFAFPDCCGPMIENMKKHFTPSKGRASEPSGSCAAMMAQMMKSCCESSGAESESAPQED